MGNKRHEKHTPEEWRAMIPGMTMEELAERTGYNRQYIRRIARSVGASPLKKRRCLRGLDEEEARRIISTSTSDASAETLGVRRAAVYRIAGILGVRPVRSRNKCRKTKGRTLMMAWLAEKFPYQDVAELFGVSKQRVGQAHAKHREELFGGQ